ncbi:MAG: hypothetical protein KGZ93_06150 [Actinobacteria bacterium]|nr:hypothetical protein [Actinomycetota bacterium]
MKQMTIRGIAPELEKVIKEEARKKGLSTNKVVVSLLEKGAGLTAKKTLKKTVYHDLDSLAGTWSSEEAEEFERHLEEQRRIDEDVWR